MSAHQPLNDNDLAQPSSVRLPRDLDAALREEAARRGISRTKLIEQALQRELFPSRRTIDAIEHKKLASLLFLEELFVHHIGQPFEDLKKVYDLKEKQAAEFLSSQPAVSSAE